ncbi:MAG TPA: cytochrome c, partial [Candidatus Binataceae bacterium]
LCPVCYDKAMKLKIALIAAAGIVAVVALAQDTNRSVWDGVFTDDQAKQGQALYNAECASCHGDQLNGGEMAPPLAGGEFMSNWNGLTVGDLFERIRTGMPPGTPSKVSRESKTLIVTYILAYNKFPSGKTELPSQTESMKQIKLEASKK